MHPCPPWAETRVFSGHGASRGARSEALRRFSADSDGPVGGAILLHHDSRRDRGDVASGPARCTFRTFRSAHESRVGWREGGNSEPSTSSITSDLNIIHDARFTLLVSRDSNKPLSYLCYKLLYYC